MVPEESIFLSVFHLELQIITNTAELLCAYPLVVNRPLAGEISRWYIARPQKSNQSLEYLDEAEERHPGFRKINQLKFKVATQGTPDIPMQLNFWFVSAGICGSPA